MKYIPLKIHNLKNYGDFCELILKGQFEPSLPGQFYMLKGEQWGNHPLLPRPISILDEDSKHCIIKFLIKNLGLGSRKLTQLKKGDTVLATGPLGNHFPFEKIEKGKQILLIGGGIGVPPLYYMSKILFEKKIDFLFLEGAKTKSELLLINEFKSFGCKILLSTEDGSTGEKGVITKIAERYAKTADFVFSCGPYGMLKSVAKIFEKEKAECYISLEERMACGYGICLGCAVEIKEKKGKSVFQRVCVEGPVFDSRMIVWK